MDKIPKIESLFLEKEIETSSSEKDLIKFRINKFFPIIKGHPELVIIPKKRQEILKILKIANKNQIPIIPYSSEWDFHGSTAPLQGGCIVDLRNLNKVEKFRDTFNGMSVDLEPGVTFKQVNEFLKHKGYRVIQPLRIPAYSSVLSAYYGKNPLLEANKYGYHQDWMILTYQMAIAKGQFIGMGSEGLESVGEPGDYPWSPRSDLGRMFLGAIGAYGLITRITAKMKYIPEKYNFLYTTSEDLTDLIPKLREVTLSTDAGQTSLIADPNIFASYLATSKQEYTNFRDKLPPWIGLIAIAGDDEYIKVEKEDLMDAANKFGLTLTDQEPVSNISRILQNEFVNSENIGISFDFAPHLRIEFYTTAGRISKIRAKMDELFKKFKVDEEKIGFMMNSLEMGRTYFCEYDIFYNLSVDKIKPNSLPNIGELSMRDLYQQAYQSVIDSGGVINLPRNVIVSQLLYSRNPNYYEMMRVLKFCVDPNNIMHPSILFNGEGGIDPKILQIAKEA